MMPSPAGPAPVIAISSQVAHGSVGLRAATFALERRGHEVWTVPTVVMPWHPGRGPGRRVVPAPADFAALLSELGTAPDLGAVGGLITGYFADADQVAASARLIDALKDVNPAALIVCDPVIGDVWSDGIGRPFVAAEIAEAIRDLLVPRADIVTPNLFELGWLSGTEPTTTAEATTAARRLDRPTVVVTSAPALMGNSTGTLLVAGDEVAQAEHPHVPGALHGCGDLFAAIFLAVRLEGQGNMKALERAAATTFDMAARATRSGRPELPLAAEQDVLAYSLAQVSMRRIGMPARPPKAGGPRPSVKPSAL